MEAVQTIQNGAQAFANDARRLLGAPIPFHDICEHTGAPLWAHSRVQWVSRPCVTYCKWSPALTLAHPIVGRCYMKQNHALTSAVSWLQGFSYLETNNKKNILSCLCISCARIVVPAAAFVVHKYNTSRIPKLTPKSSNK